MTFGKPNAKPVTIKLSVQQSRNEHQVSNAIKGFFTGLTLLLLAPALPMYEEYRLDLAAEVTLLDGQTKVYRAEASAEVYYMVYETAQAKRDVYGTALTRTLNSLVSQMVKDEPLLTLNNFEPRTLHMGSHVRYGIWTDNTKWSKTDSTPPREMSFRHIKGDAYAIVIAERTQIPLETMKRLVSKNAESGVSDLVITETDIRTVNGREVLYMRMHGNVEGVPIDYMVYVISGGMGTVQLYTYTGANLISEYESDFFDFLNGFVIEPT